MLTIDPLSIVVTIIAGLIWAYIFRSFELDKRTTLILAAFCAPLAAGRIVYFFTVSVAGSGLVGLVYFAIYVAAALIGRLVFRWHKIKRNRIVNGLLDKFDKDGTV